MVGGETRSQLFCLAFCLFVGVYRPFVLIPWIVVQELDYMKDGRDCKQFLQTSARRAVDFINKSLRNHNNTLKGGKARFLFVFIVLFSGQSVLDAAEHCIHSKNADDGILACCMQVLERGNRAVSTVKNKLQHRSQSSFLDSVVERQKST